MLHSICNILSNWTELNLKTVFPKLITKSGTTLFDWISIVCSVNQLAVQFQFTSTRVNIYPGSKHTNKSLIPGPIAILHKDTRFVLPLHSPEPGTWWWCRRASAPERLVSCPHHCCHLRWFRLSCHGDGSRPRTVCSASASSWKLCWCCFPHRPPNPGTFCNFNILPRLDKLAQFASFASIGKPTLALCQIANSAKLLALLHFIDSSSSGQLRVRHRIHKSTSAAAFPTLTLSLKFGLLLHPCSCIVHVLPFGNSVQVRVREPVHLNTAHTTRWNANRSTDIPR